MESKSTFRRSSYNQRICLTFNNCYYIFNFAMKRDFGILFYCEECKEGRERTSLVVSKGFAVMLLKCGHRYVPDGQGGDIKDRSRCELHGFPKPCSTCGFLMDESLEYGRRLAEELEMEAKIHEAFLRAELKRNPHLKRFVPKSLLG